MLKKITQLRNPMLLAVAATLGTGAASAQDGPMLEEVIVTAQKRAQSLQDVGVAVTAFTQSDVQDMGMTTGVDLAGQTPGLVANNSQSGGAPIFSIRGVGLDDFNFNNAGAVGVYIDQVYMSSGAYLNGQLMDVERVEVLKGPQGTLYGKNTTGGAINFISVKPTDEFEGFARLRYDQFERAEFEGAFGGSLSDNIQGRLSVSSVDQGEGWQEDILTGKEYGKEDKQAVRAQLAFQPTDSLDMLLNVHGSRDRSVSAVGYERPGIVRDLAGLIVPGSGWKDPASGFTPERDEKGYGGAFTLNYEFDFATFTSITAYDEYEVDTVDNYDGSPFYWADLDNRTVEQDQVSQEFRLTSASDGNFFWVAGINVSRENSSGDPSVQVGDVIFDPRSVLVGGSGAGIEDSAVVTVYDQQIDSYGAYLHTETILSDQWKLTLGGRYSYDKVSFESDVIDQTLLSAIACQELFGLDIETCDLLEASGAPFFATAYGTWLEDGSVLTGQLDEEESDSSFDGKIGIDYTPNDDLLVYASVATGYRGGRFFASAVQRGEYLFYVEPEELTAYELGFKSTLANGSLQLNGAAYYYEYDERQSLLLAEAASLLGNIPESEMTGLELEMLWRPIDSLDIALGVAYIDSEVTEPLLVTPTGLIVDGADELKGSELARAPEWSYNARINYATDVSDNMMFKALLAYDWADEQLSQLATPSLSLMDETENLSARIALATSDERWELALWGKNLTDHENQGNAFESFSLNQFVLPLQPRTYGIELVARF